VKSRRASNGISAVPAAVQPVVADDRVILNDEFQRMLSLERKRTERSRKPFLLMLVDLGDHPASESNGKILGKILAALSLSTRVTDITGWYKNNSVVGVLFTEIVIDQRGAFLNTMMARVSETLCKTLSADQFNQIGISFHIFPEEWDYGTPQRPTNPTLYPDLSRLEHSRKVAKRFVDIVGSLLGLTLSAPLFLLSAVAIKLTSRGPVFFRQERVGQHGKPFVFLKFRSMLVDNDPSVHKEYVRELIAGRAERQSSNGPAHGVYKITSDPRVTGIGMFMRKTSLDELPQLLNVLKGEMSLVGPRPAIRYEVQAYDIWHRCRLLEAKPGITGLWQVNGRSRVKFDDMVRLDIRYARTWSLWLDLKILLQTPRAVLLGEGAY
jgi:exopolysaccharide biosynthesis polyprenyl glycosylphosphotransferase